MLKQILNLEGAQKLDKKEQKEINGGELVPKICKRRQLDEPCPLGSFPWGENQCCFRVS